MTELENHRRRVAKAFKHKGEIVGIYGYATTLPGFDEKRMEELLFCLSQQATTNGKDRLAQLSGKTIADIACEMFPEVTVNDKFEDFQKL